MPKVIPLFWSHMILMLQKMRPAIEISDGNIISDRANVPETDDERFTTPTLQRKYKRKPQTGVLFDRLGEAFRMAILP